MTKRDYTTEEYDEDNMFCCNNCDFDFYQDEINFSKDGNPYCKKCYDILEDDKDDI